MGIEPTLAAWEAAVLPLNYTRARRPVYAGPARIGNDAGVGAVALHKSQKPAPSVANAVVWLPPFWPMVSAAPTLASRPNSLVCVPSVAVA